MARRGAWVRHTAAESGQKPLQCDISWRAGESAAGRGGESGWQADPRQFPERSRANAQPGPIRSCGRDSVRAGAGPEGASQPLRAAPCAALRSPAPSSHRMAACAGETAESPLADSPRGVAAPQGGRAQCRGGRGERRLVRRCAGVSSVDGSNRLWFGVAVFCVVLSNWRGGVIRGNASHLIPCQETGSHYNRKSYQEVHSFHSAGKPMFFGFDMGQASKCLIRLNLHSLPNSGNVTLKI